MGLRGRGRPAWFRDGFTPAQMAWPPPYSLTQVALRERKGTSQVVQCLRHRTSIAGVTGLILGQGTQISRAVCGQKTEKS